MIVPIQAKLALGALTVIASFYAGWHWRDGDFQKHLKCDMERSVRALEKSQKLTNDATSMAQQIRDTSDKREASTRVVFRTIIRRIPEYVRDTAGSRALDAAGGLPAGFVQLHNAAALGIDPAASPASGAFRPDAPSGVGLPEATDVIAGNYQLYHVCRGRLDDWDTWYAKLDAAFKAAKADIAKP